METEILLSVIVLYKQGHKKCYPEVGVTKWEVMIDPFSIKVEAANYFQTFLQA